MGAALPLRQTVPHGKEGRPSVVRSGTFKIKSWKCGLLCEISQFFMLQLTDICICNYVGQSKHIWGLDPAHTLCCLTSVATVVVFNP